MGSDSDDQFEGFNEDQEGDESDGFDEEIVRNHSSLSLPPEPSNQFCLTFPIYLIFGWSESGSRRGRSSHIGFVPDHSLEKFGRFDSAKVGRTRR
jgi:hypothetical protein